MPRQHRFINSGKSSLLVLLGYLFLVSSVITTVIVIRNPEIFSPRADVISTDYGSGYTHDEVVNTVADQNRAGYDCSKGGCAPGAGDVSGYYLAPNGRYYAIGGTGNNPATYAATSLATVKAQQAAAQAAAQATEKAATDKAAADKAAADLAAAQRAITTSTTSTRVEKTDEGFITHTTTIVRDSTGKVVNSKTVSTTAKTSSSFRETDAGLERTDTTTTIDLATGQPIGPPKVTTTRLRTAPNEPIASINVNQQGGVSVKQPVGASCQFSSDCGSGSCSGGSCQASSGNLGATATGNGQSSSFWSFITNGLSDLPTGTGTFGLSGTNGSLAPPPKSALTTTGPKVNFQPIPGVSTPLKVTQGFQNYVTGNQIAAAGGGAIAATVLGGGAAVGSVYTLASLGGTATLATTVSNLIPAAATVATSALSSLPTWVAPAILVGSTAPFAAIQTYECGWAGSSFNTAGCQAANDQAIMVAAGFQGELNVAADQALATSIVENRATAQAATGTISNAQQATNDLARLDDYLASTNPVISTTSQGADDLTRLENLLPVAQDTEQIAAQQGVITQAQAEANQIMAQQIADREALLANANTGNFSSGINNITPASNVSPSNLNALDLSGLTSEEQAFINSAAGNAAAPAAEIPTVTQAVAPPAQTAATTAERPGILTQIQDFWNTRILGRGPTVPEIPAIPTRETPSIVFNTDQSRVTIDYGNDVVVHNPFPLPANPSQGAINAQNTALQTLDAQAQFYERFGGQEGIPRFLGRTADGGYNMELIGGVPLSDFNGTLTQTEIANAVEKLSAQQQLTGLAHGDIFHGSLFNESNILVETLPDGSHAINFIDYSGTVPRYTANAQSPTYQAQELTKLQEILNTKLTLQDSLAQAFDKNVVEPLNNILPGKPVVETPITPSTQTAATTAERPSVLTQIQDWWNTNVLRKPPTITEIPANSRITVVRPTETGVAPTEFKPIVSQPTASEAENAVARLESMGGYNGLSPLPPGGSEGRISFGLEAEVAKIEVNGEFYSVKLGQESSYVQNTLFGEQTLIDRGVTNFAPVTTVETPNGTYVVQRWVDGNTVFLDRQNITAQLRDAGVAIDDIRNNAIITDNGPVIIDFGNLYPARGNAAATEIGNTAAEVGTGARTAQSAAATAERPSFLGFEWDGFTNADGGWQFPIGRTQTAVDLPGPTDATIPQNFRPLPTITPDDITIPKAPVENVKLGNMIHQGQEFNVFDAVDASGNPVIIKFSVKPGSQEAYRNIYLSEQLAKAAEERGLGGHVVKPLTYGTTSDGRIFYTMEPQTVVNDLSTLTPTQRQQLLDIAQAWDDAGLYHQDIFNGNIYLDINGNVMVADPLTTNASSTVSQHLLADGTQYVVPTDNVQAVQKLLKYADEGRFSPNQPILTRVQNGIRDWWETNIQDSQGFLPGVRRALNPTTPTTPVAETQVVETTQPVTWNEIVEKPKATVVDIKNLDEIPPAKGRPSIPQEKPKHDPYPVEVVTNLFFSQQDANTGRQLVQEYLDALSRGEDVTKYVDIANSFLRNQEAQYAVKLQAANADLGESLARTFNVTDVNSIPTEKIEDLALVRVMSSPDPIGVDAQGNVVIQSTFLGNPQKDADSIYRTSKHFTVNSAVAPVKPAYSPTLIDWSSGDVIVITPMDEFVRINGPPNTFSVQDTWWTPGTYDDLVLPKGTVLVIRDGSEALTEYANLPGVVIVKAENPYASSREILEQLGYQYKAQGTEFSKAASETENFLNENVFAYKLGSQTGLHTGSPTQIVGDDLAARYTPNLTANRLADWSNGNLPENIRKETVIQLIKDGYFSSEPIDGLYIPPDKLWRVKDLTSKDFDNMISPLTAAQQEAAERIISSEKLTLPDYWSNQGIVNKYKGLVTDKFVDPTLGEGLPLLKPELFGLSDEEASFLRQNVNELTKTTIPVSSETILQQDAQNLAQNAVGAAQTAAVTTPQQTPTIWQGFTKFISSDTGKITVAAVVGGTAQTIITNVATKNVVEYVGNIINPATHWLQNLPFGSFSTSTSIKSTVNDTPTINSSSTAVVGNEQEKTETVATISTPPTPEPTQTSQQNAQPTIPPFIYYSQKDSRWANNKIPGGTWKDSACGLMAGAMVTRSDPYTYYDNFKNYFKSQGKERLLTSMGTAFDDHKVVLESLGYKVVPVSGSLSDIKSQIQEYSNNGVPVWVNAEIWTGDKWVGHNTVAIGVDASGEIIFNDPWYGQNVSIPDKRIDESSEDGDPSWKVYAIIPPR